MDDALVIGAGPNGLVAANELADAGWSVTVLEAEAVPGGAVRSGELTLPGFEHDLFSAFYPLALASPALRRLRLEEHGLRWRRARHALAHPLSDGRCAVISGALEETVRSLEAFAPGDGGAWRDMVEEWRLLSGPFLHALFGPFPPLAAGLRLAGRLGPSGTLRLARQLLLPVRRLAEERFNGAGAALLLAGNALHADLSPDAAGSGLFGWLLSCVGQEHGFPVPEGGAGSLTGALVRRLEAAGGRVLCGEKVTRVLLRRGRAVAVETASGATWPAGRAILADVAAPRLFLDLVGRPFLPERLAADLERFQWDASTVKVDWALGGPVPWSAEEARSAGTVHLADDLDELTQWAAELAMGRLPSRPFVLVGQQSLCDPSRAPDGQATLWAYARVPQVVRGDAAGELVTAEGAGAWLPGFVNRLEARIEARAPGFLRLVRRRHVLGPADLEAADANLVGGAINGGTAQLHQQLAFRPVPGIGRPETPFPGLFLASASAHPGGGVHGACGANAARAARRSVRPLRYGPVMAGLGRKRGAG